MTGSVVTFYSRAENPVRSSLVANIASTLADWGARVLCVDWNLASPTLHQWFWCSPYGLSDMIGAYLNGSRRATNWFAQPVAERLHLLAAGGAESTFDWQWLYANARLSDFIESCRAEWVEQFDYVLLDSRPGNTAEAAICTAQLPDRLVVLYTGAEPIAEVVDAVTAIGVARDRMPYDRPQLTVLPVLAASDAASAVDLDAVRPLVRNWLHRNVSLSNVHPYLTVREDGDHRFEHEISVLAALLANEFADTDLLAFNAATYVELARAAVAGPDTDDDEQQVASRLPRASRRSEPRRAERRR
jgi:MinD-like ATPase involved in chromosome partitioning or flagellar assembly